MKKFLSLILIFILISCSSNKEKVLSENDLYNLAMKNFEKKNYNEAAKNFESIQEKFIFTPIATKSIIMSIYSYYKANKYNDSLRLIEYYKTINFSNEYIEYIYYIEILSKYYKFKKTSKDLTLLKDLLKDIDNFLINYNTKYSDDVLLKRKIIIDDVIKHELKIYNFYISNNNLIGAVNHLKIILENYNSEKYNPEVLYRLINLYKHTGYQEGVNKYYKLLKENYGKTKWYNYTL